MLKKISNKCVQSSEGFTVDIKNIHEIQYSEGKKALTVEIEGATDEQGRNYFYIYSETFSGWLPPREYDVISINEKDRILKNISNSFDLLGIRHKIA